MLGIKFKLSGIKYFLISAICGLFLYSCDSPEADSESFQDKKQTPEEED